MAARSLFRSTRSCSPAMSCGERARGLGGLCLSVCAHERARACAGLAVLVWVRARTYAGVIVLAPVERVPT
eukprot:6213103-Pleurochrysis_carterae.AAC.3